MVLREPTDEEKRAKREAVERELAGIEAKLKA
jgi:hypothetical protein